MGGRIIMASGASKGAKKVKIFNDGILEGVNVANYSIEDKTNVINLHKKLKDDPTYKMKDYEKAKILLDEIIDKAKNQKLIQQAVDLRSKI